MRIFITLIATILFISSTLKVNEYSSLKQIFDGKLRMALTRWDMNSIFHKDQIHVFSVKFCAASVLKQLVGSAANVTLTWIWDSSFSNRWLFLLPFWQTFATKSRIYWLISRFYLLLKWISVLRAYTEPYTKSKLFQFFLEDSFTFLTFVYWSYHCIVQLVKLIQQY